MEFPMNLFYALDFDNLSQQHYTEYQAFKVVIVVKRRSIQSHEFITQSVMHIHDWQQDNFWRKFKIYYDQPGSVRLSLSNDNCVVFESNSCGCLLRFSVYLNMQQILENEVFSWLVLGSLPHQDKCNAPNANAIYLTKSPKNIAVDNIILLVLYLNSTLCPGSRSSEQAFYDNFLPVSGMYTLYSSEFYYGFRKNTEGYHYLTCSTALGPQWFVSFIGFFSIFDLTTWILLACCLNISGALFSGCAVNKHGYV